MQADQSYAAIDAGITISDEERANRRLRDETRDRAVQIFRDAGFVIFEGVVPMEWIESTRAEYESAYWEAWETLMEEDPDQVQGQGFQGIPGELGKQGMPIRTPFMDDFAIANPWAMEVLDAVMGEDAYLALPYGSNTAAPEADPGPQHVHRDTAAHLFDEVPISTPPTKVVVNIALTDFTPENGSTELWPGTHCVPDREPGDRDRLGERADTMPSTRANMPAGSVVVRDMRMWHRGMPNLTDDLRIMLAPVYLHSLHHSPAHEDAFTGVIPGEVWDQLSDRAQRVCRFNPVDR